MRTIVLEDRVTACAWLLEVRGRQATLIHGADVELVGEGWFEGCWAGEFAAGGFDRARHVFGSGGKRTDHGWLIVTPSHLVEAVYIVKRGQRCLVSNSLAFVTRWAGVEIPFDPGLAGRILSTRRGIDAYERDLAHGAGWSLHRAAFDNLLIVEGEPRWIPKPTAPPRPLDFTSYRSFVSTVLAELTANANVPGRVKRYQLGATCSSGYDSTACAVLAAELGAHRGFSIAAARGGGADSGGALLEQLGMTAIEAPRPTPREISDCAEAEFIATGMGGDEYPFLAFAPHLPGTLLLTGFNGGDMWGVEGAVSRTAVTLEEPAGASLAEFRLRTGFVHVPVGWIGFEWQPELRSLCLSPAMAPWHLGTDYERPIARRIIEERGIPRGSFGTVKRATSMTFYFSSHWWSRAALAELAACERHELPRLTERLAYRLRSLWRTAILTSYFGIKRLLKTVGWGKRLDKLRDRFVADFWGYAYRHPRYVGMAFVWAQRRIRLRYPTAGDPALTEGTPPVSARPAQPEQGRRTMASSGSGRG